MLAAGATRRRLGWSSRTMGTWKTRFFVEGLAGLRGRLEADDVDAPALVALFDAARGSASDARPNGAPAKSQVLKVSHLIGALRGAEERYEDFWIQLHNEGRRRDRVSAGLSALRTAELIPSHRRLAAITWPMARAPGGRHEGVRSRVGGEPKAPQNDLGKARV
jgi:hypothetical protein